MKKKTKLLLITFILLLSSVLLLNSSLGRYVLNVLQNQILKGENFYFTSSILKENAPIHSISDWDGVNPYQLTIDLSSKRNELVSTDMDIEYDINFFCPATVVCTVSKNTGIIFSTIKTDSYILTVTPVASFNVGESVTVFTSASSTLPYEKTLSASYQISVQNYGFSSSISDAPNEPHLSVEITNSRPYYTVMTAFGSYSVDDRVSLTEYNALTPLQKTNCSSARVRIDFDPNYLLVDMTDDDYLDNISQTTTTLGGHDYVNQFTFDMVANASSSIIFYKVDASGDYASNPSAISVNILN